MAEGGVDRAKAMAANPSEQICAIYPACTR
jgi:hypothetical protein